MLPPRQGRGLQAHRQAHGVERIHRHQKQLLLAVDSLQVHAHHAVFIGLEVRQQHAAVLQKVQACKVGVATAAHRLTLAILRVRVGLLQVFLQPLVFSACRRVLPAGVGVSYRPRVEQQARPRQHIARVFLGIFAVEDIAVLLANVPFLHIQRARTGHTLRVRRGHAANVQRPKGLVARRITRGQDMHAGKGRHVLQLHHRVGLADHHVADLQRTQHPSLQDATLAHHVSVTLFALGDFDRNALAGVF